MRMALPVCCILFAAGVLAWVNIGQAQDATAEDSCAQASPQAMAEAAGVKLPRLPWHRVNTSLCFADEREGCRGN